MLRVAFRYGDSRLFARAVCWFRGGDAAHCEAVPEWDTATGEHTCISSSFLDGGVRLKRMPLPADKWRIYEVEVEAVRAWGWFFEHRGEGYDSLGLFGFVWRPIRGWARKWFCSEAVAAIMLLDKPESFDLVLLESVCNRFGRRVQ
jgi:hypothetical protein